MAAPTNPKAFDRRITPWRDDLAAAQLEGKVEAARFVEGVEFSLCAGQSALFDGPRPDAQQVTTLRFGERFTVYDRMEGYAWGQCLTDGYVGWVAEAALLDILHTPTHRISALASHIYNGPKVQAQIVDRLPMGARLAIEGERDGYAILAGAQGLVPLQHIAPLQFKADDWVAVAEMFLGTPYQWGGKTVTGIDCSGLVQVALEAGGINAPRDTDMQRVALGQEVDIDGMLKRGDIVFWKGHVGIMLDEQRLLHANAHHMMAAIEPVEQARARIAAGEYGPVTAVKRL